MRIIQIVSGMYNPSAGPSYSIARLADELYRQGENVSVLTSGKEPVSWPYEAPIVARTGWLDNHLGVSPGLVMEIRKLSQQSDILHGHSIWRFTNNVFPLILDRHAPAKIVCSPRGAMSPWSMQYKNAIKAPFWKYIQKPALCRCHCFHVTAPIEYDDIRRVGLNGPVAIIPNGIDVPALPADISRKRKAVFLSRIDPKKGLDILISSWDSIALQFSDWELVIAGSLDCNYAARIQALAKKVNAPRIKFVGQVLGEEKLKLLAGASLFVLPSYSENFGLVVAEALAHGLPVITTTETPWKELTTRKCGWYVPPELSAFTAAMQDAMSRPLGELHATGMRGREWMLQDYSWERVAEMMLSTYEWLLHDTDRPDFVIDR